MEPTQRVKNLENTIATSQAEIKAIQTSCSHSKWEFVCSSTSHGQETPSARVRCTTCHKIEDRTFWQNCPACSGKMSIDHAPEEEQPEAMYYTKFIMHCPQCKFTITQTLWDR
jgi:hypothetical protein